MNHRCTVQKDSFPTRCGRVYLKEKGCQWGSVKNDATFATSATPATQNCFAVTDHCLPLPQGHGSLRPVFTVCRSSLARCVAQCRIVRAISSGKSCHLKNSLTDGSVLWQSLRRFYPLVSAQNALLPLWHATTIAPLTLVFWQCVRCLGQVLILRT